MLKMVHSISYELTGSEIIALLLESREIKNLSPLLNKAQRTKSYPYFIYTFNDLNGIINFAIQKTNIKNKAGKHILNYYGSRLSAKSNLKRAIKLHTLCDHYSGFSDPDGEACFSYQTQNCLGICINEESKEDYNERAKLAVDYLSNHLHEDVIIVTTGRQPDEKAIILIKEGNYQGYGYIHEDDLQLGVEECLEAIDYIQPNPETNLLIRQFLETEAYDIIPL